MYKFSFALIILAGLLIPSRTFAQSETLRWKPLIINETQRIWFDAGAADTLNSGKANIWILQMHKPPLSIDAFPDKIYRSQTLYALNLDDMKYGILKVIYYGINNKELYNFDYHIDNYPDNLKYTYPVKDNPIISELVKKITHTDIKGN